MSWENRVFKRKLTTGIGGAEPLEQYRGESF
jgi:hypothetical protein